MIQRLILALLLFVLPASAQVVQLTGGSSTEYQATGGAITLYAPTFNTQLNAGVFHGALVGGTSVNFVSHGWTTHLGDFPVTLNAGDLSLSDPIRGVVATRHKGDTQLTIFGGLVGQAYAAPFFYAQRATQFGAGFAASTRFRGLDLSAASAITAGRHTYLESVRKRWQHVQLSETAGALDSRWYAIGSASVQASGFAAGVQHSDYIYQGQRAAVNSENASFSARGVSAFGSMFQSATVRGSALGGSWRVRAVEVRGTEILSKQRAFLGSVTENLTQRIHVSQYYSRSNGTNAVSFGGGYSGNVVSADVSWQMVFYPFVTAAPFQRTLAVTIGFQLPWHGTSIHVGTIASPTGGARWTAYGGSYASLPWELPTAEQHGSRVSISGAEIRGLVTTQDGPLEGAAVRIGREIVYTNSDGAFLAHVRSKGSVTVDVAFEEFVANGSFEIEHCPSTAEAGTVVSIQLRRR